MIIDIRDMPDVIDSINAIVNAKGIAEVKTEKWKGEQKVTVVQQMRTLKTVYPPDNEE